MGKQTNPYLMMSPYDAVSLYERTLRRIASAEDSSVPMSIVRGNAMIEIMRAAFDLGYVNGLAAGAEQPARGGDATDSPAPTVGKGE